MRSPALISASSKAGCHAVLASLSGRYPPLEGRSPTCYSPVCHSTHGLLHFRVRLACVRHAASVDSEPGSNSHVKFVAHHRAEAPGWNNSLTRGRFIGSCVVQSVLIESGSSPVAFARTEDSGRPVNAMPPADSHCLKVESANLLTGCVYLHAYLVFKEPTTARQWRPTRHSARSHRPGPAWKASPPVGRGAFRGTLRGYYRPLPVSTLKLPAPKINRRVRVELERDARARNCCV